MKYELVIRELTGNDLSRECKSIPEKGEVESYITSLVDDIGTIPNVSYVNRVNLTISIELSTNTNQLDLMRLMKPYFSNERYCFYRFVSLSIND